MGLETTEREREEEREGKRDVHIEGSREGGKRSKARKRRGRGERRRQRLVTGMAKQRREGIQREEISSERRDSVRILYNRSTVRRPTKYYYVQLGVMISDIPGDAFWEGRYQVEEGKKEERFREGSLSRGLAIPYFFGR